MSSPACQGQKPGVEEERSQTQRKKEHTMILFVIFVALVVALGLAAGWGGDLRHGIDSEEGQRLATLTFPSHRA